MRIPITPVNGLSILRPTNDLPLAFIDGRPFLLELQGSLSSESGDASMAGAHVGKLDLSDPVRFTTVFLFDQPKLIKSGQKKPVLQVAHHRLEGKPVRLETPLAVLKSRVPDESTNREAETRKRIKTELRATAAHSDSAPGTGTEGELMIEALIWDKILFSKRPEPIIQLSSDI